MFEKFRRRFAVSRLQEEKLYEKVLLELSSGKKRGGLWAKALANCNGAEEKAESLYIRYRVQSIKDEMEIVGAIAEDAALRRKVIETPKEEKISHASFKKNPPNFFSYNNVIIKHNFLTYWVGEKSFNSAQEAKVFIDSRF